MESEAPSGQEKPADVEFEVRQDIEPLPVSVLPVLSDVEVEVLRVLTDQGRRLTLGQLVSCTDFSREELGMAIGGLRAKGLISSLNTVVESYSCRFPGVRVDGR